MPICGKSDPQNVSASTQRHELPRIGGKRVSAPHLQAATGNEHD